MATTEQVAELRHNISEPNAEPYTDEYLSYLVDTYGIRPASARVWTSKAGALATMVDVSEGGSSRKMSDLHKNALTMAKSFTDATSDGGAVDPGTDSYAPRSRRIVRR